MRGECCSRCMWGYLSIGTDRTFNLYITFDQNLTIDGIIYGDLYADFKTYLDYDELSASYTNNYAGSAISTDNGVLLEGSLCNCDGGYMDSCGTCDGDQIFIYEYGGLCDCDGNTYDECMNCSGNSTIPDGECDCNSIYGTDTTGDGIKDDFTPHIIDCFGECGGVAVVDCFGECGGGAVEDECGVCAGNNFCIEHKLHQH